MLVLDGKKPVNIVDIPGHERIRDQILNKYSGKSLRDQILNTYSGTVP